jgi:hypothetical protein
MGSEHLWPDELRQWTDADVSTGFDRPVSKSQYCTRAVCARLDALDEGWVQKLTTNGQVHDRYHFIKQSRGEI